MSNQTRKSSNAPIKTNYVAVLLAEQDIDKLEEIAIRTDSTIAAVVRGIIKQALSNDESISSIIPSRNIQKRRRR